MSKTEQPTQFLNVLLNSLCGSFQGETNFTYLAVVEYSAWKSEGDDLRLHSLKGL